MTARPQRARLAVLALVALSFALTLGRPAAVRAASPDTASFAAVLTKYVADGRVDYAALRADRASLDAYLKSVEAASSEPGLADSLNAYNALVLAALLDSGPFLPKNVTDLKGFFDAKQYRVAGKNVTLNALEGQVRTTFKDARVHFAFNCGAMSCPPLPSVPFDAKTVDAALTERTTAFLNGKGVRIDDARKTIAVTKLMDWYKQDFVDNAGSLEGYLRKFVTDPAKKAALEAALTAGYTVSFQSYDWRPNQK